MPGDKTPSRDRQALPRSHVVFVGVGLRGVVHLHVILTTCCCWPFPLIQLLALALGAGRGRAGQEAVRLRALLWSTGTCTLRSSRMHVQVCIALGDA